jgi:hypothetical protein
MTYYTYDSNILTYEGNKVKVPIGNSSHTKKTPVARSSDFLWKI